MDAMLYLGTLVVATGLGAATIGVGRAMSAAQTAAELTDAIVSDVPDAYRAELSEPFAVRLLGPARRTVERAVLAVTPSRWIERMRRNATLAGLGRWGLEGVVAMKGACALAGALAMPVLAAVVGASAGGVVGWVALGAGIGFFAPDLWMARRADARQDEIRRMLPETLDLLAIAVQAGMGLEQAIDLVTRKLPGALGEEFTRMLREVQLGSSRREALQHLRQRTDVRELSSFALALSQADTLGAPVGEVLRVQAAEMRQSRRLRAREQAAKVPVKLLFPLLVGIFPALGIVVIGPAIVSIAKAFG